MDELTGAGVRFAQEFPDAPRRKSLVSAAKKGQRGPALRQRGSTTIPLRPNDGRREGLFRLDIKKRRSGYVRAPVLSLRDDLRLAVTATAERRCQERHGRRIVVRGAASVLQAMVVARRQVSERGLKQTRAFSRDVQAAYPPLLGGAVARRVDNQVVCRSRRREGEQEHNDAERDGK